jgi:hypothetical protein
VYSSIDFSHFNDLELNFIDILFHMSTIAFNNVSRIFLDFRISNKMYFYTIKRLLKIYKQQIC